jgi:hypothetical protein
MVNDFFSEICLWRNYFFCLFTRDNPNAHAIVRGEGASDYAKLRYWRFYMTELVIF